ncbi:CipA protein [Nannizzia gypsea CBS 118893]|uniref:CipA protein n=1 Tax=Arthroderma gypseum (strain ATCC MYA-4604 / CBS 118893) TaxID=535722 RepID=E4UUW2_ARTGP|nr:CipA protein [Nannizzia gypsea CBS 118893]EFR01079.1 CipA protein [Nannizzia gypsea CBS 118893]
MSYLRKVAIVGATGNIGRPIVREILKAQKHEVTAITRTVSKAVMPDGVKIAKVDYDNQPTLVSALRGQDVLIITMASSAPKDIQLKLVEAAAEAGVPYIVPNGWGSDASHPLSDDAFIGPGQREIYKRVEELGKSSWINFVTSFWYEFSLVGGTNCYGFDIKNRSVIFFDDGTARINTSTWNQTGKAVANFLSLKEKPDDGEDERMAISGFRNKNVYISSFLVSQKDMFQSILRVTGTKEADWEITHEPSEKRYQAGVELFKQGERIGFARALYTRVFYPERPGFASGAYEPVHGLQNDLLNLPKENLDERTKFAIENIEEFRTGYSDIR